MYQRKGYSRLKVDLRKLYSNIKYVQGLCSKVGVEIAGVVKGCNALLPCVRQYEKAGVKYIASSRLEQLARIREAGIRTATMMVRIPMLSECADIVKYCDYSLNSEIAVLKKLDQEAKKQKKIHKVILMADLGDLREGFWDKEEMVRTAILVEEELKHLELAGVGVNVGCYGSVLATHAKLKELVVVAEAIEEKLGRELEVISGGATSSLMRVLDGDLPERINMLRVGEGILLAYDLPNLYGYKLEEMYQDVFRLEAEVIEVKNKPSHPVGEIGFDAFGHRIKYVDRGVRKRALIGLGKCDYGDPAELLCCEEGVEILGASSDHTILDIEDCQRILKVGDILEFNLNYATMVYVTNSENIEIVYSEKQN